MDTHVIHRVTKQQKHLSQNLMLNPHPIHPNSVLDSIREEGAPPHLF